MAPPIPTAVEPANPSTTPNAGISAEPAENRLRADRDRFVALAFCWADTLIELDTDLRIVFAAGLTMATTGHGPGDLIGRHVDEFLMPKCRPAIRRLLAVAEKCGRIDDVSITFISPDGDAVPVDIAAHKLPDLGDQSFLAVRHRAAVAGSPRLPHSLLDGLPDSDAFIAAATGQLSQQAANAGAGLGPALTLLSIPEIGDLRERLGDADFRTLASTTTGYLLARSTDRSAAAWLADGCYGLIHKAELDVAGLESQLLSIVDEFSPPGEGASIESATIMPNGTLSGDVLGQVVGYAIRHFRDAGDTGFTLDQLRDDLPKVASRAAEMAKTFTRLVDANAFHIALQPIVSCDAGEILFYEGLARIDGRDGESPNKYIAYAEETGQICRFDLAMVEKALVWLEARPNPDLRISINLSGLSMLEPDFITRLHGILEANPATGGRLAFEITDSARIRDLEGANRFVQGLRQSGHMVGLDDFAIGIGGFRVLETMDVDFVKFGKEARLAAEDAGKPRALLESLIGFCRTQGVRTIATTVETVDSMATLRTCGIEFVQGYLLGRPSPDIEALRSALAAFAQSPAA